MRGLLSIADARKVFFSFRREFPPGPGFTASHESRDGYEHIDHTRVLAETGDLRKPGMHPVGTFPGDLAWRKNAQQSQVPIHGRADIGQVGEFLHLFSDPDRIVSDRPVQLLRGKQQFNADSMVYNGIERSLQLDGRVRAMLLSESKLP